MRKSDRIPAPYVPAKPVNYIFSTFLTSLLCISFTLMLTSTYLLKVNEPVFVSGVILMAFLATSIHILTEKKKWVSRMLLFLSLIVPALLTYFRVSSFRDGMDTLLFALKRYTFRAIPFTFVEAEDPKAALTEFLLLINIIPVLFTSFVITRRKNIILSVIFFIPFLFASVALNYKFPKQIWCELAIAGVLLLCFFQSLRKSNRVDSDRKLCILAIPALCMAFLVGLWFPQNGYDKQELASRQLKSLEHFFKRDGISSEEPESDLDKLIKDMSQNYMGSIVMHEDENGSIYIMRQEMESLNQVGHFDPPDYTVLNVTRRENELASGYTPTSHLYIRNMTLNTYTGHEWLLSEDEPDSDSIYGSEIYPEYVEAPYLLLIDGSALADVFYYPPCYTDWYMSSRHDDVPSRISLNVQSRTGYTGSAENKYAVGNIPVRRAEDIWTEEYLEYVNSANLYVPEETREGILDSGILPEWYMDIYEGRITCSDYDKVIAVTSFVSQLHPYDKHTDFPPADEDFVLWFMTESPTGFCVHYASTSVILLRMLGVPARYCSGYMVDGIYESGVTYDVSTKDAHAWFEFFSPEFGWIMGDATPGNKLVAADFDVNAVMKEYNIPSEVDSLNLIPKTSGRNATPTPAQKDPTASSSGNTQGGPADPSSGSTGTASDKSKEEKGKNGSISKFFSKNRKLLMWIGGILLVLILIRAIYSAVWKRAFRQKNINARARAYYHYFSWIGKKWKKRPYSRARTIAQKAVFSEDGITDDELKALIESGKLGIQNAKKTQPWYRRVSVKMLYEVKV